MCIRDRGHTGQDIVLEANVKLVALLVQPDSWSRLLRLTFKGWNSKGFHLFLSTEATRGVIHHVGPGLRFMGSELTPKTASPHSSSHPAEANFVVKPTSAASLYSLKYQVVEDEHAERLISASSSEPIRTT